MLADRKIQSRQCNGLSCVLVWAGAIPDRLAGVAGYCHQGEREPGKWPSQKSYHSLA
jgi:hypothetical protein